MTAQQRQSLTLVSPADVGEPRDAPQNHASIELLCGRFERHGITENPA